MKIINNDDKLLQVTESANRTRWKNVGKLPNSSVFESEAMALFLISAPPSFSDDDEGWSIFLVFSARQEKTIVNR